MSNTHTWLNPPKNALLALADGTVFHGISVGAHGSQVGEVVFNTAMTGYQEILTDPSYAKQLVTLTYPHIGNVGANALDTESNQVQAAGLIVRDASLATSSWRSQQSLSDYLRENDVVAIADIDTRALTRKIRDEGAQHACLLAAETLTPELEAQALAQAQGFAGLQGMDLATVVTCDAPYTWSDTGEWSLADNAYRSHPTYTHHVVVYDFGVKHNILRKLTERGARVTVVPATMSVDEVMALKPSGVMLSNGPGDPEPCDYAIAAAQAFIAQKLPLFGICLGHQILGLATGAQTVKMKFGHHGANHPVEALTSKRVFITSQNHGFAVDEHSLPDNVRITHRSLFDQSLQGIALTDAPAFSFQGHPEASPGPSDIDTLFDCFVEMMRDRDNAQTILNQL